MDNNSIIKRAAKFIFEHRRKNQRLKIITGLSMLIVFATVYMLILPAITAGRIPFFGLEGHTYSRTESKALICGLEEHSHDDGCYETDEEVVCGLEEHKHSDSCFALLPLNDSGHVIIDRDDGWFITVNSNGTYTLTYEGKEIPEKFIQSDEMEPYADNISIVFIRSSVKKIGDYAFADCNAIEAVVFEENTNIKQTGASTFRNCSSLKSVNLTALKSLECIGGAEGGWVFSETALTNVIIPSNIKVIGDNSFRKCQQLTNVRFEKAGSTAESCEIKDSAFRDCYSLESINLEDIDAKTISFPDYAVFYSCGSLKSIIMPAEMVGALNYPFQDCGALKSIVFEQGCGITYFGRLGGGTNIEVLDLTPLTKLGDNGVLNSNLEAGCKKVILPKHITELGSSFFANCGSLSAVEFEEGSLLEKISDRAFYRRTGLSVVDLSGLDHLKEIGNEAFSGCTVLNEVVIPSSASKIGDRAFADCINLGSVVIRAENMPDGQGSSIFENVPSLSLTIGKEAKTLSGGLISQIQKICKELTFEYSGHSFTVSKNSALLAPFEKSIASSDIKYYADENGCLYQLTDGGKAILLKVNEKLENVTIPESINAEGKSYTVSAVAKNAFKNSSAVSVTFDKIQNITEIEDFGFAYASKLNSINGITKTEDVYKLFEDNNIKIGRSILYKTAFGDIDKIFGENANPTNKSFNLGVHGDSFVGIRLTFNGSGLEEGDNVFYTGDNVTVIPYISNYNDNAAYRVYIKVDDNFDLNDLSISGVAGYEKFELHETDDPNVYYYEFIPKLDGDTFSPEISIRYPNFTFPGSRAQIWSVVVYEDQQTEENARKVFTPGDEVPEGIEVSKEYFDLEWITKPKVFNVKKNIEAAENVEIVNSGDKNTLSGLKYRITYKTQDEDMLNHGSDLIRSVVFKDTLTLPDGFKWREGLSASAVRSVADGGSAFLYGIIDGKEYLVFSIQNFASPITEVWLEKESDGRFSVCWRVVNTSSVAEISVTNDNTMLEFGSDIIEAYKTFEPDKSIGDILNEVDTLAEYTFSEPKESRDTAKNTLAAGHGRIEFHKNTTKTARYMNESIEYKLTLKNPTAFDYANQMREVHDWLHNGQYIPAESMEKLIENLRDDETLEIMITNPVITTPLSEDRKQITTVDGITSGMLSVDNTGENTEYNGCTSFGSQSGQIGINGEKIGDTIYIRADLNRKVTVTCGSNVITIGEEYNTIQEALDSLAYIVTQKDGYQIGWKYADGTIIRGGETREYILETKAKSSLMNLERDLGNFYDAISETNNTAEYRDSSGNHGYHSTPSMKVSHDLSIHKSISGDIIDRDGMYEIDSDGEILEYGLHISHYGTGTYDVLPVTDHMTGRQLVLAECDDNEGNSELTDCIIYTDSSGKRYYILGVKENQSETIYRGVYINGFYADYVSVKPTSAGYDTILKYYLIDTPARDFNATISYKAVYSQEYAGNENTETGFAVGNETWLNDYPTHRLWDVVAGGGTAMSFIKDLVDRGRTPSTDIVDETRARGITKDENTVTYRLMLKNSGDDINSINATEMYDVLPLTGTAFDWDETNLKLEYYVEGTVNVYKSGELTSFDALENGGYHITKEEPSARLDPSNEDRQYIAWDKDLRFEFEGNSTLYIYVELTFADSPEQWEKYLEEYGTHTLHNIFYVYELPSQITHTLSDPGKVLLQKGVYEIGHYIMSGNSNGAFSYFIDSDRYHYSNNVPFPEVNNKPRVQNVVTYYFILKNSGKTNLYLTPVYDILPEGFEFMSLRSSADATRNDAVQQVGNTGIITDSIKTHIGGTGWEDTSIDGHLLAVPQDYIGGDFWVNENTDKHKEKYSPSMVRYCGSEEVDGRQRLKFAFEVPQGFDPNCASDNGVPFKQPVQYDKEKDMYYLLPGHFTQFAYTVYTGNADINEAVNTVAMEYYDPYNSDARVVKDDDTKVRAAKVNNKMPNDGSRELWDNTRAEAAGFESELDGHRSDSQWLVSDVSITRGNVSPGIKKVVNDDDAMVPIEDPEVSWTINSYNNGTSALRDYTIEDTIDAPYRFEGPIRYSIFAGNGKEQLYANHWNSWWMYEGDYEARSLMMYIVPRTQEDIDNNQVRIYPNGWDRTAFNNGNFITVKLGEEKDIDIQTATGAHSGPNHGLAARTRVKISKDEKTGRETLSIHFVDSDWAIPAGGKSVLTVNTNAPDAFDEVDADNRIKTGSYLNSAVLSPADKNYDDSHISQGTNLKSEDGENMGVMSGDLVTVYSGFPTGAIKLIEEKENRDNNAASRGTDKNYILLDSDEKIFTYTLQVQNANDKPMDKLVLIDNLPFVGDASTLRDDMMRDSQFKVRFADDLNYHVYTMKKNSDTDQYEDPVELDKSKYTVSFSTLDTASELETSWDNENDYDSTWTANSNGARSVRLVIDNPNGDLIPGNSIVQFKFDAIIENGDANPGEIAWNSFVYKYDIEDTYMMAAPMNVGIKIPAAPYIQKVILNHNGNESPVEKDTTFRFIVYDGDELDFGGDYSLDNVGRILSQTTDVNYTYIDMTVNKGESVSEIKYLKNIKRYSWSGNTFEEVGDWIWDGNKQYHAVELDSEDDNDPNYFSTNGIKDQQQYNFRYDPENNTELKFANKKSLWSLKLFKRAEDTEKLLQGALFGIYSPNKDDQMSVDDMNKLNIPDENRTRTVDETTYYLMETAVTTSNGIISWDELSEESYIVFELTPPDGYYSDNTDYVITREEAEADGGKAELTVYNNLNEPVELPSTGGRGLGGIVTAGVLITLLSAVLWRARFRSKKSS